MTDRSGCAKLVPMRWEQLFSDLEARYDELADAEVMAELADRQRVAAGGIGMVQRIAGVVGRPVRLRTLRGSPSAAPWRTSARIGCWSRRAPAAR